MRAPHSWICLLGILPLAFLPAPAGAQAVGSEFQINTYTTGQQGLIGSGHLVAADASGNFVVVWRSYGQDGSLQGIFGQRFDSEGGALGSEFRVNSFTTSSQRYPSVAAAADGAFVVVWSSYGQDGSSEGIFGQRFDGAGIPQGGEFRVNSHTTGGQGYPSVAAAPDGSFVVVWSSFGQDGSSEGIFGQRYDSGGGARGSEFLVNSFTPFPQRLPSVASDASGNFVVVWESYDQDGSEYGIFGQRYDSGGVPRGDEFQINSFAERTQSSPAVASDASGNFVVAWQDSFKDTSEYGIFGQRYDSAGMPQGSEFQINTFTIGYQFAPSVALDASGNFVVVWFSEYGDGSSYGAFGQRYDSAGMAQGGEFQTNSSTRYAQQFPSVAATSADQFVVAWDSYRQDGSGFGVFGQRFDFAGNTIAVVSPNTNVRWRIGSLQKIQWTHSLGVNASFRIELDRDDDGTYEELIAAHAQATSARKGSFAWTVTGPPSGTARVRVSWSDDLSVSDTSDVTFQIRPAAITP